MVDDESIDAIHVALFELTGNAVMGVFHTLLAGKTGQCVPGRSWPGVRAFCPVPAFAFRDSAVAKPEGTASVATTIRAVTTTGDQ